MKKLLSLLLSITALLSIIGMSNVCYAASVSVPGSAYATINSTSSVTLKWKKSSGAAKYIIYKKTNSSSYKKYKTVTACSVTITGLSKSNSYNFKVKAVSKNGKKSAQTSAISVKTNWGAISKYTLHSFDVYKYGPDSGWYSGFMFSISSVSSAKGYRLYGTNTTKGGDKSFSHYYSNSKTKFYAAETFIPEVVNVRAYKYDSNKHKIFGPKKVVKTFNYDGYFTEPFYNIDAVESYMKTKGYASLNVYE